MGWILAKEGPRVFEDKNYSAEELAEFKREREAAEADKKERAEKHRLWEKESDLRRAKGEAVLSKIITSFGLNAEEVIDSCRRLLGDENMDRQGYPDGEARLDLAQKWAIQMKEVNMIMTFIATHCN